MTIEMIYETYTKLVGVVKYVCITIDAAVRAAITNLQLLL